MLLLAVTYYRFVAVQLITRDPNLWRSRVLFHGVVVVNAAMVLHDLLLLFPAVILTTALGPHTLPILAIVLKNAIGRNKQKVSGARRKRTQEH